MFSTSRSLCLSFSNMLLGWIAFVWLQKFSNKLKKNMLLSLSKFHLPDVVIMSSETIVYGYILEIVKSTEKNCNNFHWNDELCSALLFKIIAREESDRKKWPHLRFTYFSMGTYSIFKWWKWKSSSISHKTAKNGKFE